MYRPLFSLSLVLLTVLIYVNDSLQFEHEAPLLYAYSASANTITIDEFIAVSYQPVLIKKALNNTVVQDLKLWDFAHLSTSLEAATSFCLARANNSKRNLKLHDVVDRVNERNKKRDEKAKYDKKKENEWTKMKEISLRRFALEGRTRWSDAFADITKEIGMMVKLPRFLEDFEFHNVETVALHYIYSGVSVTQNSRNSKSFSSATVICLLEGNVSFMLTPFDVPFDSLWCGESTCTLPLKDQVRQNLETNIFLTRVNLEPNDCFYIPPKWYWQSSASADSVSLRILWEEDLSLREDVLETLTDDNDLLEDIYNSPNYKADASKSQKNTKNSKNSPKTLWEVLPRTFWRSPVLWSDKNPMLHLVRFYLLSSQERNQTQFLRDFRADRGILPDLVDCPVECEASAKRIFILLDTDKNGFLTMKDALYLTQDIFVALTLEMDELVDELMELGMEQWVKVVEGGGDRQFMDRAKERMEEGAKITMRRLMAGETNEKEELEMKEKLPGLYADVMAARETNKAKTRGNDEL